MRDDRLDRLPGTAQHHEHCPTQPLHGTDRSDGLSRYAADEPHVGEVEDDLHPTVRDERQREREHRPLIDVGLPFGIDPSGRQRWGAD